MHKRRHPMPPNNKKTAFRKETQFFYFKNSPTASHFQGRRRRVYTNKKEDFQMKSSYL